MKAMRCLKSYPSIDRVFTFLRGKEEAAFLDSSARSELGEYSIIGCRPYKKLVKDDDGFTVNGEPVDVPFEQYLKQYLEEEKTVNDTGLPIIDGAIGYFSYDYGRKKEGVETCHEKTLDIPDCVWCFYDVFVVEDHRKNELHLIANGRTCDAKSYLDELEAELEGLRVDAGDGEPVTEGSAKAAGAGALGDDVSSREKPVIYPDFHKEEYKAAVDDMINYIVDGDIYVVNMTHQLRIKSDCDPYDMFSRLRLRNPAPFGAFLDYGDHQVVCASPERFMKMKGGLIKTRPIKGTRKRGATPEEDEALKNELATSDKDQSELLMIVDLERNDLNRICVPGSVKVTELFKVETYATVFHLVSNIEGRINEGLNAMDLIGAAFPGGSITGAPKLRAMELIDQEEKSRRNLYTGSIGYLSLAGDCDLNIVIRTAVHKDGVYHLGVGGGITCESELEFEYEETWQKARALLETLGVEYREGEMDAATDR